ncbi:MAG: Crp/Fnr family transcriptional regulator [Bacteroidota bacterium]|jgi:CRP-like cAMP-binding protein
MNLDDILSQLNPDEISLFQTIMKEVAFEKGSIIIKEGQVASHMYYIKKGALRSFFYKDGENVSDFFFFENSFASDFASFYSGKPSSLNLECLEDVSALQINRADLSALGEKYPIFERHGRIAAEYAFLLVEERMRLLHTGDLETRFRWMMKNFPTIFMRVPQYQIASYLGAKPESLSRIKARIGKSL